MKKLKKITVAAMCLGLITCLVACSTNGGSTINSDLSNQSESDTTNSESSGGLTLPEQGWTDVRK